MSRVLVSRREKSRSKASEVSKGKKRLKDRNGEDEEKGEVGRYRLLELDLEVRRKVH